MPINNVIIGLAALERDEGYYVLARQRFMQSMDLLIWSGNNNNNNIFENIIIIKSNSNMNANIGFQKDNSHNYLMPLTDWHY